MTDVALRDYLEGLIRSLKEHVDLESRGNNRALELATRALHDKFEEVNRFRDQLREERGVYARHDMVRTLEERMSKIEIAAANTLGRWWMVGLVASGLGAAVGLLLSRIIGMR